MVDELTLATAKEETPSLLLASEVSHPYLAPSRLIPSQRVKYPDALDPQGMEESALLEVVIAAVQDSMSSEGVQIRDITPDRKLMSLGLISLGVSF